MCIYLQIATLIAVYANWDFAFMNAIGWGWAGVIWLFSFVFYLPLDGIKFAVRYILRGDAWELITEHRVCMVFNPVSLLLERYDIVMLVLKRFGLYRSTLGFRSQLSSQWLK